jgi:hypothetical protein
MKPTSIGQRIRTELSDIGAGVELERKIRGWLAGDDAFNLWFLETTKGGLADQDLMTLVEGYGSDQDAVENAWEAFLRNRDEAALTACFAASLAKMESLKNK